MKRIDDIKDILMSLKEYLISLYGDGIKQVIIYGSYARGDATRDSDIDVLIIINDEIDPKEVEKDLEDYLFEIILRHEELVTVFVVKESVFDNYNSPLILNVKEEGVAI